MQPQELAAKYGFLGKVAKKLNLNGLSFTRAQRRKKRGPYGCIPNKEKAACN